MENLDVEIDKLERDKLISLIQENQVRIGKYNIRYTKSNRKNTLEHWAACFDSYDKLLRSIPKDVLKVEREVRTKFVSSLSPERKTRLLSFINRELDVLYKKLEDLYSGEFQKVGAKDEFFKRLEDTRAKCQGLLETHMQKCEEALNGESSQIGRMPASEICRLYDFNESLLHELNLLETLQNINRKLGSGQAEPQFMEMVDQVQQGIKEMASTLQNEGSRLMETVQERKERKMQVARETMLFRDVVINIEPLIDQTLLPVDQRNQEVVQKLWKRIEEFFFLGRRDWEPIQSRFKSVFELAISHAHN